MAMTTEFSEPDSVLQVKYTWDEPNDKYPEHRFTANLWVETDDNI